MAAEVVTLNTDVPGFHGEKEPSIAVVEATQDVPQDVVKINNDVSEEDWVYPYSTSFCGKLQWVSEGASSNPTAVHARRAQIFSRSSNIPQIPQRSRGAVLQVI
jgi:hypothetical protein